MHQTPHLIYFPGAGFAAIVGTWASMTYNAFFRIKKTSVGVFFKNYSMVHNASLLFFEAFDGPGLCAAPNHIKTTSGA